MNYVLITVLGIAVCSFTGAVIGFIFENISEKFEDALMGCAAGIMLCAAVLGLVIPSVRFSGDNSLWIPSVGIFCGALFLTLINRSAPKISRRLGMGDSSAEINRRTLVFVMAMAIHHFPEGIAAGVSFGTGDISDVVTVTSGIAFQNIPESMIIIPPLLKSGTGKRRAAFIAFISGLVEVLGVFFGYFAITVSVSILPFALAFAAGTMIFVVIDDMIPQTHSHSSGLLATYCAMAGFCMMLIVDNLV